MVYSGFADEAGASIDVQIKATLELGWRHIECRNVDWVNLTDVSDEAFEEICQELDASGVKINCFGSAVANWGKDPRSEEDYLSSLESLRARHPQDAAPGNENDPRDEFRHRPRRSPGQP